VNCKVCKESCRGIIGELSGIQWGLSMKSTAPPLNRGSRWPVRSCEWAGLDFGRYSVRISAGAAAVLTQVFHCFPKSHQANSRIVPWYTVTAFFQNHFRIIIPESCYHPTLRSIDTERPTKPPHKSKSEAAVISPNCSCASIHTDFSKMSKHLIIRFCT
jgi:hypothetical protein